MPLLPVYYTTTNLRKRKQTKQNTSEHDKWLASMGLTPGQIKAKKTKNTSWKSDYSAGLKVDRSTAHHESPLAEVCDGHTNNRSIMSNLHKENETTQKQIIAKSKRVAPLWNKGGLMFITDGTNLEDVGKKK